MKPTLALVALVLVGVAVRLQTRPPAPQAILADPASHEDTPIARGRVMYVQYGCAACHGDEGKGGFSNPNSETEGKVPGVNYVAEGYTRGELRQKLLEGLATIGKEDPKGPRPPYRMPGWAGRMTNQEAADLVEYLFSIYPKTEAVKFR